MRVLNEMKTGKAPGPSDQSLVLMAGNEEAQVMVAICQSPRWIWEYHLNGP